MRSSFLIGYVSLVLSLFILDSAIAKPKVSGYKEDVKGVGRVRGIKLTWTFFVDSKSKTSASTSSGKKIAQEFPSLEAALSDPRVSAADKSLIKNTYIPKLARFNADLKKLNLDAAMKQPNGKEVFSSADIDKRFNDLLDQHASGLSIKKLSTSAVSE